MLRHCRFSVRRQRPLQRVCHSCHSQTVVSKTAAVAVEFVPYVVAIAAAVALPEP